MSKQWELDNSGDGPLKTPGLNGVPLDYTISELDGDVFSHVMDRIAPRWRLNVREIAMLQLMNDVTEMPHWFIKIFDDDFLIGVRKEAMELPLISEKAWDWCVCELRDKARFFDKNKRILAIDSQSRVCKSDHIVPGDVKTELQQHTAYLVRLSKEAENWHPLFPSQILPLVDPFLFPLVFSHTKVLSEGGQVDLERCVASCGQGVVAPSPLPHCHQRLTTRTNAPRRGQPTGLGGRHRSDLDLSSGKYQCLPCEVQFTEAPGDKTSVRVTSYINGLNPAHHQNLYTAIQTVISAAVQSWNDILVPRKDDRLNISGPWSSTRITDRRARWTPDFPDWAKAPRLDDVEDDRDSSMFRDALDKAVNYMKLPEPNHRDDMFERKDIGFGDPASQQLEPILDVPCGRTLRSAVAMKWRRLTRCQYPEPGRETSYEEWKERNKKPPVSLQTTFRFKGLQIMVGLLSIELGPDNPTLKRGTWQFEGMLNDHIIATAMYNYDVSNISSAVLSFRHMTQLEGEMPEWLSDEWKILARLYGLNENGSFSESSQDIGSIVMPEGRMVVWPNTVKSLLEPCELLDKEKAGHSRFVILRLVDPHYRITSTRNVPPQQHDWWAEEALRAANLEGAGLPPEIIDLVAQEIQHPRTADPAKLETSGTTYHALSHQPHDSTIKGSPHVDPYKAAVTTMAIDQAKRYREEMLRERQWADMAIDERIGDYDFDL